MRIESLGGYRWLPVAVFVILIFFTPRLIGFNFLHYGVNSSHGLVLAKSAVEEPVFFMNSGVTEVEGERTYITPYNSFPVPVFYLTGLVVKLAGEKIADQIVAARFLMMAFLIAACVLMVFTFREMGAKSGLATSAVILTTSSATFLTYWGVLFNTLAAVAGCTLVVWMMARHVHGRLGFSSVVLLSFLAALTGWECAAFFAVWFFYALYLRFVDRDTTRFWIPVCGCTVAALVMLLLMAGQLWYEAKQLGITHFLETPSAQSIMQRGNLADHGYENIDEYKRFYLHLIARLDQLIMPFPQLTELNVRKLSENARNFLAPLFITIGVVIACVRFRKYAILIIAMSIAPFVWYIPMKAHSFAHSFQIMFFITTASCAWFGYLSLLGKRSANFLLIPLILCMIVNGYLFKTRSETAEQRFAVWTQDIDRIRAIALKGERVAYIGPPAFPEMRPTTTQLYLYDWIQVQPDSAKFIVSTSGSLPNYSAITINQHLNLFTRDE